MWSHLIFSYLELENDIPDKRKDHQLTTVHDVITADVHQLHLRGMGDKLHE